jgi:hypothetical protein
LSLFRGVKPVRFEDGRVVWREGKELREVGPATTDVAGPVAHNMQSFHLGVEREASITALLSAARADGVHVVLTQVPLRGAYCDERDRRFPRVAPFMRERAELLTKELDADAVFFDRGTDIGIPDDRFYDYGHLTEDGTRRMALHWLKAIKPRL